MEDNDNQDQDQDPDQMRSQRRRYFQPEPKPPQLLFAENQQPLQHPSAADDASLSLFLPTTTHQPYTQTNDAAGTATYRSTTCAHKPSIQTTNEIVSAAPAASASADQLNTPPAANRFRWMKQLFSIGQWEELELQALIYKYMLAGASIPMDLILPIKRSLLTKAALNHQQQQQLPYYHSSQLLQAGYWGRCVMDGEPGRCRRTDGKKWRCSREVMAGRKYCERHTQRGRNRSRKLVEIPPTTPSVKNGGSILATNINTMPVLKESSGPSSAPSHPGMGIESHDQRAPWNHQIAPGRNLTENYQYRTFSNDGLSNDNSNGRVLRHFFDDWPTTQQQGPCNGFANKTMSGVHYSGSNLSVSASDTQPSDFCLKLYTESSDKCGPRNNSKDKVGFLSEEQLGLLPGLGRQMEASMGGPLAEALRASKASVSLPSTMYILHRPI